MAVNLSPVGGVAAQFFDNSGNVLTGGLLYSYLAGTTTPAVTYTNSSGFTANSNPIVLDAAGRVSNSGEIWLTDGVSYKFILQDQNAVQIASWDNIVGINSNFLNYTLQDQTFTATQGQTVFTLTTMQYVPGTNNLAVFVNGSKQQVSVNYQETSSTVFTFVDGLNVDDIVEAVTAIPVATSVTDSANVSYNEGSTGAVTRSVEAKLQESVSIKDFGAVGDNTTDDTIAIQAALDSGNSIYIPKGTYKITTALSVPPNISITGAGAGVAILSFTSVNGLVFQNSSNLAPIAISGFQILGNGTAGTYGVYVPGDATASNKVTGLNFTNIYVVGFEHGFHLRSAWATVITGCESYNCWRAVDIEGKSILTRISNNYFVKGSPTTGTGVCAGLYVDSAFNYDPSGITEGRPENVQMYASQVYGFDYGIYHVRCLYAAYEHNDIDNCQIVGVYISQPDGNVIVRDNWIACNPPAVNTNTYGVHLPAQASAVPTKVVISGNNINSALYGYQGIFVDGNRLNVTITDNTIAGFTNLDMFLKGNNQVVTGNACNSAIATSVLIQSSDLVVGTASVIENNYTAGIISVNPSSNGVININKNFSPVQSTMLEGVAVIPTGLSTVTVTFAALNGTPPAFTTGSPSWLVLVPEILSVDRNVGNVWATATTTALTITSSSTAGSDANVYWRVSVKQTQN
jgi:hypothetical protein